jgi:hypothetical protein
VFGLSLTYTAGYFVVLSSSHSGMLKLTLDATRPERGPARQSSWCLVRVSHCWRPQKEQTQRPYLCYRLGSRSRMQVGWERGGESIGADDAPARQTVLLLAQRLSLAAMTAKGGAPGGEGNGWIGAVVV